MKVAEKVQPTRRNRTQAAGHPRLDEAWEANSRASRAQHTRSSGNACWGNRKHGARGVPENRRARGITRKESHVGDHVVTEGRALDLGRTLHEAGEVVGDLLGTDGAIEALEDEVGRLDPTEVAEHHLA